LLEALPTGLAVDEDGFVFSRDSDDAEEQVYYGLHRLRYDTGTQTLRLSGVLPDLDRFRLLAVTAPKDFAAEVEQFATRAARRPSQKERVNQLQLVELVKAMFENLDRMNELAKADAAKCYRRITLLVQQARRDAEAKAKEPWSLVADFEFAPEDLGSVEIWVGEGKNRKKTLTWDAETKTLTAWQEVKERARIEFLAAAAQPDFKQAVDRIYLDSARFRVSVWWLIGFYMLLTMGELCISPVGLSLVTKLAPAKHVGFFMGGWFLATAVAEKLAQVFGGMWGKMPPVEYFLIFVVMCGVGALFMAVLVRALKRMMHGVT
jgi:hypothetical protein